MANDKNDRNNSTNMSNISFTQTLNEMSWHTLYSLLYTFIRRQVYTLRVPSWYGQENDIVDDIVQEAMRRMLERIQRAEQGREEPVQSLEHMIVVIAYNYCRDLRRRDKRLVHTVPQSDFSIEEQATTITQILDTQDLSEEATEQVYQEAVFTQLAHEVALFPNKQREALLIDLANHMSFEERPTALQKAFLRVDIQLQDYQQLTPENVQQRARQAALLHHAYKRIAQLTHVQRYAEIA